MKLNSPFSWFMSMRDIYRTCIYLAIGIALAFMLLWPSPEPSPEEMANQFVESGIFQYHTTKGSGYLLFNGKSISCSSNYIFGSKHCPGVLPYDKTPMKNCTATFINAKSPFGLEVKMLISMSCEGKALPQFTLQGLASRRQDSRKNDIQYLMPIVALAIFIMGGQNIYMKGRIK